MIATFVLVAAIPAALAQGNIANEITSRFFTEGRAVQAVIWAMPAVNTDLMLQAALKAGAKESATIALAIDSGLQASLELSPFTLDTHTLFPKVVAAIFAISANRSEPSKR
jgi:hypothetical protein